MNMLSLDDAYGSGATTDIHGESEAKPHPSSIPTTAQPMYSNPAPSHAPPPSRHTHSALAKPGFGEMPGHMPASQIGGGPAPRPRRQVRFVHDADTPRHRFARTDVDHPASDYPAPSQSWLEKNKLLVTVVASITLVILIAVLVIVARKNSGSTPVVATTPAILGGNLTSPLAGGAIPAYVGGNPSWESASNYGAAPMAYY